MALESFNHWPEISLGLHRALKKMVKEVADSIGEEATILAPVDTGFLAASVYVKTTTSSTYGKGKASAFGTPNVAKAEHQELFPELESPPDDLTAYVAVAATYGIYLEMGTRYMPPQSFFYQAVDNGDAYLQTLASFIEGDIVAEATGL